MQRESGVRAVVPATARPVAGRTRQRASSIPIDVPLSTARVLALQRLVGNTATTLLVARQVAPPVVALRPTLWRGDLDKLVGVAQQKLDVLGARPELAIDGEFGARTQTALTRFQRSQRLSPSGALDDPTWSELDRMVPGGQITADGSLTPVRGLAPADPTASVPGDVAVHPVLKLESTGPPASGPAVSELHEKLNNSRAGGAGLPVAGSLAAADAIVFDSATDQAVRAFQRAERPPLKADGVVGRATWARLDRRAPGAVVGRIQRPGPERARGKKFNTRVTADWALEPDRNAPTRLVVRVRYRFDNDPVRPVDQPAEVGRILEGIRSVWNHFKAVQTPLPPAPARPSVDIEFQPAEGSPPDHTVLLTAGVGPTDASHYFINPTDDIVVTAAHEFGHHIGLVDEYQQTAADHLRETGKAAPVGEVTGDAEPRDIALELGRALRSAPRAARGDKTLAVVQAHNLVQGGFAQRVAGRYRSIWGVTIVADFNQRIPEEPSEGSLTRQRQCTHPFLYNEDNLMAGTESEGGPHALLVEPRHVREYAGIVGQAQGGLWEPAPR